MEIQTLFAFGALLGHVLLVFATLGFIFSVSFRSRIRDFADNFGYIVSFFIALMAMLGSLYFSDIVGWEPCTLCWYQRIAIYPLVIVFGIGVWKQEKSAWLYGVVLSVVGLMLALYHIFLQFSEAVSPGLDVFCSVFGAGNCSEVFMREFGYITFPVLSATALLFIVLLQLTRRS